MRTNDTRTQRTAADLPKGTRVTNADGRMGTVNGYDVGHVTNTEHVNYGREYIGVTWDPTESIPWGQHNRPFVDELRVIETAPVTKAACPTHDVTDERGTRAESLPVPRCESGVTYGVWDELAGGFTFAVDCAMEAANWAAEQLDEDPDGEMTIKAVCREHEEQPADNCEDCLAA